MAVDPTLLTANGSFTGDPAAYALTDYARWSDSVPTQSTIKTLYVKGNVLADIPWVTDEGSLEQKVKRFTGASLPRVDFMPVNMDPFAAKFSPEDYIEKAYLVRNFVDVDTVYVRAKNQIQNIQRMTPDMYMTAMTYKINDYFINNQHQTGDVLAPVGIKYRLSDPANPLPADMVINAGVNIAQSNTATGALGQASLNLSFLADQMLTNMGNEGGDGVFIYTNAYAKNAWNTSLKAINAGGGFTITKDNYDRQKEDYRGAVIRDLGRKADQSTPVVGFENADGTPNVNGNYTSLYFVRMGQEWFHGWHWGAPSWKKVGVIDNQITDRMFFEYIMGFMNPNLRALGRIYGIQVRG